MSEKLESQMEIRKVTLVKEFETLTGEANLLIEQGRTINKRLSEIASRKLFLQGAYTEITSLSGDPSPIPVEEIKEEKPVGKKHK